MTRPTRLLFIQHTSAISGSAMSLLYTAQGLDRTAYEPLIALTHPSEVLRGLYGAAGIATVDAEGISAYRHTTGGWFGYSNPLHYWGRLQQRLRVSAGVDATRRLVERVRPDLVHLNSITLLPSAIAVSSLGLPLVWHVRESPVFGLVGWRRRWIRQHLLSLRGALVFLSDYDRSAWTGRADVGETIPNFVDFRLFDRRMSRDDARRGLGLEPDDRVLLYLGGISRIKGIETLAQALARLRPRQPKLRCVMPSGTYDNSGDAALKIARRILPLVGWGTFVQRMEKAIRALGLSKVLIRLPADSSTARYFAAADVVVVPSVEPHFARPVIEAGAMARPVVASDIGGVRELVCHEKTGLLVKARDPIGLASAIEEILENPESGRRMGEAAYDNARAKYDSHVGLGKLEAVYERLLGRGPA